MAAKKLSEKDIRSILRDHYGRGQYRITSAGQIDVCGRMPNSTTIGWYLYGYLDDPETMRRIADECALDQAAQHVADVNKVWRDHHRKHGWGN